MRKYLKLHFHHFIVLATLLSLAFIVYGKLLQFGLYIDDWYNLSKIPEDIFGAPFTYLKDIFISPYGGKVWFFTIIRIFFGYQSFYYYLVSLLTRIFAAWTVYLLVLKLFEKKQVAFLAAVYYLVSYNGWWGLMTENMNASVGLGLMNIGLVISLNLHQKKESFKKYLTMMILFFISLAITPIRMPGLLLIYPLMELLFTFLKKESLKRSFLHTVLLAFVVFLVWRMGFFRAEGSAGLITYDFASVVSKFLQRDWISEAAYFLTDVFNSLIPLQLGLPLNKFYDWITFSGLKPISFLVLFLPILILNLILHKLAKDFKLHIFTVFWLIFLLIVSVQSSIPNAIISSASLGLLLVLLIVEFGYLKILKGKQEGYYIFWLISWLFLFSIIYHFHHGGFFIESRSRYMVVHQEASAILITYVFFNLGLLLANFISKLKYTLKFSYKELVPTLLLIPLMMLNIKALQKDFIFAGESGLYDKYIMRNYQFVEDELMKSRITTPPLIFLIYDDNSFVANSIGGGGQERFYLFNHRTSQKFLVQFVYSWIELEDYVFNKKIPIENVFAFKIKNREISTKTENIRKILNQI